MKIRWFVAMCLGLWVCSNVLAETEKDYYAVYLEGKKIGRAIQTRTESEDKVTTTLEMSISIQRGGSALTVEETNTSVETVDGKPLSFEGTSHFGILRTTITGQIKDGKATVTTSSVIGQDTVETIDWPEDMVMAEGLRLLEKKMGLKEGTVLKVKLFLPSQKLIQDTVATVGKKEQVDLLGRVVEATRVTNQSTVMGIDITTTSYVDEEGNLLKDTTPIMGMNMEMIACSKEFAMSQNDVFEFIDKMFVDSPKTLPNVEKLKSATYYLRHKEGTETLVIPETGQQTVGPNPEGGLKVTVFAAEMPKDAQMPYKGNDERALEALKPSTYVQSNHEEIIKLAKKAIGDTKDAGEAAKKIEAFVANYIDDKGLSVGYASAAEVAASRQGDCSEFAVLTAALCRAVGIPAEVACGIAYIDEFAGVKNKFGGHAWTQVYVGDRWVAIDAAFKSAGLNGFNVGHITLAQGNGDPAGFFSMATTMGNFNIEKIETEK